MVLPLPGAVLEGINPLLSSSLVVLFSINTIIHHGSIDQTTTLDREQAHTTKGKEGKGCRGIQKEEGRRKGETGSKEVPKKTVYSAKRQWVVKL